MCIIATTEQYLLNRIDSKRYTNNIRFLTKEVNKKNKDALSQDDTTSMEVDEQLNVDEILSVEEYKFPLYRHWSIYESMYHSQYLATRLGVWKEVGKKKLQIIFVKLGIPLLETTNKWQSMLAENKKIFVEHLEDALKDFELDDISYPSFYRNFGYKMQITAGDAALATSALLEFNTTEYFWKAYDALSEYLEIFLSN